MARVPLAARLGVHLASSRLLERGAHVVAALSGGTDSLALLHLLRFGLPAWDFRITAAHYDHALRVESVADALWVRGLCRAWQVPLHAARASVPPRGEAQARAQRYAFLNGVADAVGATHIATGHQRDDQAETVLFRIARGTGLAGLAGIPARRDRIVRPLLPFTRAELAAYARDQRLRPREDASNRSLAYARNRIRHLLLPALERAQPGAAERLARIAELASEAQAAWRGLAPELAAAAVRELAAAGVVLARPVLLGYDPPSRARVLRHWAQRLGAPLSRRGTAAALKLVTVAPSGRAIALGGGLVIAREFDRILLDRPARSASRPDRPLSIVTSDAGRAGVRIGAAAYDVAWGPEAADTAPDAWNVALAATVLRFPLELRAWRPGDRIVLEYGAKKLKKLFAERRVGRSERARRPVLAEQGSGGRVLWVAGVARAAWARPHAGEPAWHIRVRN